MSVAAIPTLSVYCVFVFSFVWCTATAFPVHVKVSAPVGGAGLREIAGSVVLARIASLNVIVRSAVRLTPVAVSPGTEVAVGGVASITKQAEVWIPLRRVESCAVTRTFAHAALV